MQLILADLDTIQVCNYPDVPDGCVLCGHAEDYMVHLECLRPDLCMAPRDHHPFVPFVMSTEDVMRRTAIDSGSVGTDGFPRSWYASDLDEPFAIDIVQRLADIGSEAPSSGFSIPELVSYRSTRASLGLPVNQRIVPTFDTILEWPRDEYTCWTDDTQTVAS
jgi:hypothetical protein